MQKEPSHQQTLSVSTSDGWNLRIIHYAPMSKDVVAYPVVLCHGLAANKHSCDFGQPGTPEWQQYSLAAYLSQPRPDGGPVFDVWVPELRGAGQPMFDPQTHPERYRWCVDDYIDKDVPAIVACVQQWYLTKKQRAPPLFWVGKSMGGMIAYAYGETPAGQRNLKGVVTLGSPVVFAKTSLFLEFLTRIAPRNVSIPLQVSELLQKSQELLSHFKEMGVNAENVDPAVLEVYLREGLNGVISSKVLSQFSLFFKQRMFCRYPRYPWLYDLFGWMPGLKSLVAPHSYTNALGYFSAPLFLISGAADSLASQRDIQYVRSHVGSTDVSTLELSKDAGYRADYGHLDLTLGRHVREEVYPKIYDWLCKHSQDNR